MDKALCGNCGLILNEAYGLPVKDRPVCPACGSNQRIFTKHLHACFIIQGGMRLKAFSKALRRAFVEQIIVPSFSFSRKSWAVRYRLIDRRSDLYHEIVTDQENGSIIHECREPLSAHRDHGSARPPSGSENK